MALDTLRAFVTVVEHKNFSRAAELLHLSQPGVSLQIQSLENELGATLLHRTSKSVTPTKAGELLYERAKEILALYEEALQEIHLLQNTVSGSLQIGASYTIGEYILPKMLARFTRRYPEVEIAVKIANTDEIVRAVRSGELEIGLVEGAVSFKDLKIEAFMRDEMVLVASPVHPLGELTVSADQLQDQAWILRESGSGTRKYSDQFIEEHGLRMKRHYVFSSSQGVKEAVSNGLGIALLSSWVVRKELQTGDLREIRLKNKRFYRHFSLVLPQSAAPKKATSVFWQLAKKERE